MVDQEEVHSADAAREVHVKRVKEITIPLDGKLHFPLAEGILRQPDPGETRLRSRSQRLSWPTEPSVPEGDAGKDEWTVDDCSGRPNAQRNDKPAAKQD